MDFTQVIGYFNFVISAVIFVFVLFANKTEIGRLRKLLEILDNGGWRNCPYYKQSAVRGGRRRYDPPQPDSENPT